MNVTIKAMFAVFLVIFLLFIALTSLQSRTSSLRQTQHFDYYQMSDQLFLSFLSSPQCLTVGDYADQTNQVPIQGLIDVRKLEALDGANTDPGCVDSYYFLYSVEIKDLENGKSWNIGIDDANYPWVDRKIRTSLPVAVMYTPSRVNFGEASLNVHTGVIPQFYGTIKRVCAARKAESFPLKTNYIIRYQSSSNLFFIGDDSFTPYFTCEVEEFLIPKGDNLVYIDYDADNNAVGVRV